MTPTLNKLSSLPEPCRDVLAAHEAELLLFLEGGNQAEGIALIGLLTGWMPPLALVSLVQHELRAAAIFAGLFVLGAGPLWWELIPSPTDVAVSRSGVHLFWRIGYKTRHRLLRHQEIRHVEVSRRAVTLVVNQGERVKVRLIGSGRQGVQARYRVRWNTTNIPFDESRVVNPNHIAAFQRLLEAQRKT